MNEINLKAKTNNEEIILAYLNENASQMLAERINSGNKTLAQCWNYIMAEARKQATNGCACIEDKVVYGWATHFFEEDDIDGEKYNKTSAVAVTKTVTKTSEKKKVEKYEKKVGSESPRPKRKKSEEPQLAQFSFDDLLG